MKFLRHFTAAVLAVAVIAGLGLLWAHAAGGGPGIGGPGIGGEQVKNAMLPANSTAGFSLGHTRSLIRACLIEAVLAAAVITVSAASRQRRRSRRAAG